MTPSLETPGVSAPSSRVMPAALTAALCMLVVCLLTYGPLLTALGFYWDDWPGMLVTNYLSHQDLREYVSSDRPVSTFLLSAIAPLLGKDPFRAHAAALLLRWLISVAAWWIVAGIWPRRRFEASAAGLLVAIYPGFSGHAIAWIHGQGVYIPLLLTLISFACSVWTVRAPRLLYVLLVPALAASLLSTFVVEYFVGLELIRPVLLAAALGPLASTLGDRVRKAARLWLPYIPIVMLWLAWRAFFFHSTRQATDQVALFKTLVRSPLQQIGQRVMYAVTDLGKSALMVWSQAIAPYIFTSEERGVWIEGLAILVVTAACAALWLRILAKTAGDTTDENRRWGLQAMAIGLIAMCFGGLPVWAANRHVVLGELSDRYTVPLMFGAALLAVGAVRWALRTSLQQILAIALLVGFGAVFQYRSEENFATDWRLQRQLFWQLKWRVPGLEPGTALLLVDDSRLSPQSNYSIAVPLNLIYAGRPLSSTLAYWAFRTPPHDPERYQLAFEKDQHIEGRARSLVFRGDTSSDLSVWYHPPACLQVLSPADAGSPLPEDVRIAASLSHWSRIKAASSSEPDSVIFGREPRANWCYYFEKAELGVQWGDWNTVARLGDEARRAGLHPAVAAEWQPFIAAYKNLGREKEAVELLHAVFSESVWSEGRETKERPESIN